MTTPIRKGVSNDARVTYLIVGPAEHGVVIHARALLETLLRAQPGIARAVTLDARHPVSADALVDALDASAIPETDVVHVHVTDRLFGSPENTVGVLRGISRRSRLSVTLHDLPQASDGAVNFARRGNAYADVARLASAVTVSSRHELGLLRAVWERRDGGDLPPIAVVPLPIERAFSREGSAGRWPSGKKGRAPREIGVFGFLYPGKGHRETLLAMVDVPPDVGFVALGRPSPGHEDLVDDLRDLAAAQGRDVRVTGFVPESQLSIELDRVTVPVSAHRHISASGSINRWIGAGRRPLVARGPYTEEIDARMPWAVRLVEDLGSAIGAALTDPDSTRIHPEEWDDREALDTLSAAQAQHEAIEFALSGDRTANTP